MRKAICISLTLLACSVCGCVVEQSASNPATQESKSSAEANSAEAADSSNLVEEAQPSQDMLIIDVRSQREWDEGHLSQAIHIPHTEIADKIGAYTADKNSKIVVYCAVGGRAGKAKEALEELGYVNVENAGGFDDVKARFASQ